jgi:hypothetical protein
MFKMLKLAAYGLAGYAAYQMYLGINDARSRIGETGKRDNPDHVASISSTIARIFFSRAL